MPDYLAAVSAQAVTSTLAFAAIFAVASSGRVSTWLEGVAERNRARRARRHFDLPVVVAPAHEAPCRALAETARNLWQLRDLDQLSHLIARHAQAPVTLPDGARSYDTLIFAVLQPLFEARTPFDLDTTLEAYRTALSRRTDDPALIGLWLRALQTAAWLASGMEKHYESVDHTTATAFRACMQEIEAVLARTGFDPTSSILLAEPWAHAATLALDPHDAMATRFAVVEVLDQMNARIWAKRARLLLPGWFGSVEEIGALMERAIGATRETYGQSILVNVVMAVHHWVEVDRIPGYSDARFMAAIADLAREASGQADINAVLSMIDTSGWVRLPEEIMRRHVTEIHADAWATEAQYLALFDRAWKGHASGVASPEASAKDAKSAAAMLAAG